jgi:hypothetical protein
MRVLPVAAHLVVAHSQLAVSLILLVLHMLLLQLLQLCLLGSNHRCWQALLQACAAWCEALLPWLRPAAVCKQRLHYAVCIRADPPLTGSA